MSSEVLFKDLNADNEPEVIEVESLCMNCMNQGITKLFLTRIPIFNEILISSFSCPNCGFENKTVEPAGKIEERGVKITIHCLNENDLNRRIARSKYSSVQIPSLDSTFPVSEGSISTIEGVINDIKLNIQNTIASYDTELTIKGQLIEFVKKLDQLLLPSNMPYDLIIEDPSGTSQVENTKAPAADPQLSYSFYLRSMEENHRIGIFPDENAVESADAEEPTEEQVQSVFDVKGEVMTFHVNCHKCNSLCESNMKMLDIPYFKEVIIMATVCEACGYRDNEVKGGGGIEEKGRRVTLCLTDPKVDMSRDLLKSDTALIRIPELEFETYSGTLGGKFTTVEGILLNIRDELSRANPFLIGDSAGVADEEDRETGLKAFVKKIDKIISNEITGTHLILEDPAGNVYIQNPFTPDDDPNLVVEDYERSYEENEMLGLNDMKTENYELS